MGLFGYDDIYDIGLGWIIRVGLGWIGCVFMQRFFFFFRDKAKDGRKVCYIDGETEGNLIMNENCVGIIYIYRFYSSYGCECWSLQSWD